MHNIKTNDINIKNESFVNIIYRYIFDGFFVWCDPAKPQEPYNNMSRQNKIIILKYN